MMKTLRQTASFKAPPSDVYELLMDSRKHAAFSGAPAKVSRKVGGKFIVYGGYVLGRNLALVPNRKIVQAWRGKDWPEGHFSKATFSLARTKTGTRLTFTQSGIPNNQYEHIKSGWVAMYWKKMQAMIAKKPSR
jgi:activator of HSP90 ATPase